MKKNFFKKLSFVLALAMIVSVLAPAAGAFAASKPKLSSTKKYLFLGQTNKYDFNISNKKSGWSYKWTSSNKAVATVASNGLTTGKSIGTAEISVVIKDKDGEEVTELTADVIVKDSIETVKITNLPEDAKLNVNEEHDFNRSFTTYGGSTKKTTSVTKWTVDSDKATISSMGVFKATEAGEYTVTARSFQSNAKYSAWLKDASAISVVPTDTFKVTVVASMVEAKQVDLDTVKVTFDTPMTDVDKNLTFYSLVGSTEVKVTTVKKVTMNDAKTEATVDFYVNLTEGATYVVKYTDMASKQFVAATVKPENVVKLEVKTTEAVVNQPTDISVALLDANGVDISKGTGLLNRVDFTTSSNKTFLSGKSLVIFNKGDETTVTATFHTYKYDTTGAEVGNVIGSGTVVGVDAASLLVGAVKAYTIVDRTVTAPSYTDVKTKLAVGDAKRLFVQLNTKTGTEAGTLESSSTDINVSSKFKFESSDNTVLFVDNSGNLYPVKAGTVTVVVKYDDKAVDVITINVNGERKATMMELGATTVALSNTTSFTDSYDVSVKIKDQLGDDMTVTGLTFEKLAGSPDDTSSTADDLASVGTGKITFTGAGKTVGTYTYKITANGLSRFVSVTVTAPTSATPSSYQLVLSTTDADSKSVASTTAATARPTVGIDLYGYAGVKTSKPSVSGGSFKVEVTNPDNVTTVLGTNSFALTSVSGSAITKVKSGTYKVTAYEQRTVSSTTVWVAVDVDYFTVKDTQVKPVLAEVKATTYTGTSLDTIARACFKVTFDGAEKTDFVMGDIIGDVNTSIFVKNVKWTETITDSVGTYTLEHTIDVNMYITKTN